MYLEFANACISARENKGYTQEELAELCNISRQSISDYERGEALPKETIMLKLINTLDAPFVGYAYLRSNKVGEMILPAIQQKHLSACILGLQVDMDDVDELQNDIAKIGKDDNIDKDEHPKGQSCRYRYPPG